MLTSRSYCSCANSFAHLFRIGEIAASRNGDRPGLRGLVLWGSREPAVAQPSTDQKYLVRLAHNLQRQAKSVWLTSALPCRRIFSDLVDEILRRRFLNIVAGGANELVVR